MKGKKEEKSGGSFGSPSVWASSLSNSREAFFFCDRFVVSLLQTKQQGSETETRSPNKGIDRGKGEWDTNKRSREKEKGGSSVESRV